MTRRIVSLAVATLMTAGIVILPAGAATASTGCSAVSININSTAGGEPSSWASGRSHVTGKHYVSSINSLKVWTWNADNDNGKTDKTDTYFGIQQC